MNVMEVSKRRNQAGKKVVEMVLTFINIIINLPKGAITYNAEVVLINFYFIS